MRIRRRYPFGLALFALLVAFYLWSQFIYMAGFWDGFISDLQRAEIPLFGLFNRLSLLMSCWFVFLGFMARRRDITTLFFYSCVIYLLLVLFVVEIDQNYRAYLFDDRGG